MRASAHMIPGTLRSEIDIRRGHFQIDTDEPESVGGEDTAPAPHELLPAALASCVATTLVMYARTKEWDLGDVQVDVNYRQRETPPRFEVEIAPRRRSLRGAADPAREGRRELPRPALAHGRGDLRGAHRHAGRALRTETTD